jgi:hypothetical protein
MKPDFEVSKYVRWQRKARKQCKRQLVDMMGGACVGCGYKRCASALDFHHLDPDKKKFGLGACLVIWA